MSFHGKTTDFSPSAACFRPLNFKLKITQDGGLRLVPISTSVSAGPSGEADGQIFYIKHNRGGQPQLCMAFSSQPKKLYLLQAPAGQPLDVTINSPAKRPARPPTSVSGAHAVKGVAANVARPSPIPGEWETMLGKKPVVLGAPSATPLQALPREPAGTRSLLKPTVRDALTARRRESSVPATQTGARYDASDPALLSCWRLSPGYDDIVAKVPASGCERARDKKELASLVTKRRKTRPVAPPSQREGRSPEKKTVPKRRRRRKPQAASLLSEALLTAGRAPHEEAAASGTEPCHKPEAADFTSETEEPEWESNGLPFKIDTVFSLATQEPQTDYPGMQEEEEAKVGTEKKPIKVEEFCQTHSLTQDEMLDMCGSVFVVLERLDEKHMDERGTRRTQPRCSDYCRKRTLNYLCMLDLIRCHPTKRRRIKMEEGQTDGAESVVKKEEPSPDTAATGKEGGALKAAVKAEVKAAVEEPVSAPAPSRETESNIRPFASSFSEHDHPLKDEDSGVKDQPVCTGSLPSSTEQGKASTASTSFRLIYCDPSSSATTTSPSSAWPATPGRILPNTSVVLEVTTSTLDRPSSEAMKQTTSRVSPSDDSAASSEAKASSSDVVHATSAERSRSGQRSPVSSGLSAAGQRLEPTTAPVREAETTSKADSDVTAKKRASTCAEGGGSAEDTLAAPTDAPSAHPADVTAASPFVDVSVPGQVAGSGGPRGREVTTSAGKRSKRLASLLSPGPPAASAPCVTVPQAAAVTSMPASTVSGAPRSSPQLIVKYVAGPEGGRSTRSSSTAARAGQGRAAAGADASVTLLPGSQTGALPSSLTPATVAAGPVVPKATTSVTTFFVPKTAGAKKRVAVSIAPSTSAPSHSRLTSLVSMGAPPAATGKAAPGLVQLGGSQAQNVTVGATPPASSAYAVLIQDPQVANGAPCLVFVGDPALVDTAAAAGHATAEGQNQPFSVASLSAPLSAVSSASARPAESVAPCPATSATAAAIARVLNSSGAAWNSSSVASPAAPLDVVTLTNCNVSAPAFGSGTVGPSAPADRSPLSRCVYNPLPHVPPPVSLTPAAVCVAAGYSVSRLMYVKPGDGHGSVMQDTLVRVVSDSRLGLGSAGLAGAQVKVVASPQSKTAAVAPGSVRVIPLVSGAEVRPVKTLPCVASRGQCVTPPAAALPALQRAPGSSSSWSHMQVLPGSVEKAARRESLVSLIKHPPTSTSAPATCVSARRAPPVASTVGPQPRFPAQPFAAVSAATTGPLGAPGGDVPLTPCTAPKQTGARGPGTIRVIVRPPASSGSGANPSATSSPLCVLIPKPGGRTLTLSKVSSSEVPASTFATTSAPSCPTSSAALPPERFHRTTTTGNLVPASLPASASSLLSTKAVAPCPSSTASAPTRKLDTERTSTDNSDGDQGRRARFERKYPLPPGVVIKAEPVTFGYPTDADATVTPDDNGASSSSSSPSTAAVSSASNAVTSSSPPQAPDPAGACTTSVLGAHTADLDSADSSAVAGAGQAEPPAGGECVEPPTDLAGADTADDSERRGPPLDLDCPDLDMECDGGGYVYDEPPVLTPVSPLPGAEDNADISDPAQESVSTGQARSSDARTPSSVTKLRQTRPSRKKRKTSAGATPSQPLSSPSAMKSKPQAKSQSGWAESEGCDQQELTGAQTACSSGIWTRPQSASLLQTSSDAGTSSVTSLSASSTSVVSAGPSTSSHSEATPSSSSNDRIRRLKEMLKKQNEQLEEIRRQRSAHIPRYLSDD